MSWAAVGRAGERRRNDPRELTNGAEGRGQVEREGAADANGRHTRGHARAHQNIMASVFTARADTRRFGRQAPRAPIQTRHRKPIYYGEC